MDQTSAIRVPLAINEPVRSYAPQSAERSSLKRMLETMPAARTEIPCIIGGKEIRTGKVRKVTMPHAHGETIAEAHYGTKEEIELAIKTSLAAKADWERLPWYERAAVFLRAADLLAGPWRDTLNAATMLNQSKNVFQAEIDAACEFVDFLRFNAQFYQQIIEQQPISSAGIWNRSDYRPLEGFVFAATPFNFTAIAGNLPAAPAMLGNTVVWKPSDNQLLSGYHTMKLFEAAGLPPGVINFVPCDPVEATEVALKHPDLAGIHFTGSTQVFKSFWKTVGENIGTYRSYPRIVGETGGKDFVFAHPSADPIAVATALTRGAFEYQGQKCSAASRAYISQSLAKTVQDRLMADIQSIKVGDVRDFRNFVNAVIDQRAYQRITGAIETSRKSAANTIIAGGTYSDKTGWFIDPTVIRTQDPHSLTMTEELFGPVLTLYVYEDAQLDQTLTLCDQTSPYALTGAILAQDRLAIDHMAARLRHSAGNLYINDKPTGAVVGQQPFGGARASGTNDKAGSALNLLRWLSPRTIKETLVAPTDYRYPFLGAE